MPQSCLLYIYPNYYVFNSRWSHWRPSICPNAPQISHPRSNPELLLASRWRGVCPTFSLKHIDRLVCQANLFCVFIIGTHGNTRRVFFYWIIWAVWQTTVAASIPGVICAYHAQSECLSLQHIVSLIPNTIRQQDQSRVSWKHHIMSQTGTFPKTMEMVIIKTPFVHSIR